MLFITASVSNMDMDELAQPFMVVVDPIRITLMERWVNEEKVVSQNWKQPLTDKIVFGDVGRAARIIVNKDIRSGTLHSPGALPDAPTQWPLMRFGYYYFRLYLNYYMQLIISNTYNIMFTTRTYELTVQERSGSWSYSTNPRELKNMKITYAGPMLEFPILYNVRR